MLHFCGDEAMALLAVFPWLGILVLRVKAWWFKRRHKGCHCEGCQGDKKECAECPQPEPYKVEWMSQCCACLTIQPLSKMELMQPSGLYLCNNSQECLINSRLRNHP